LAENDIKPWRKEMWCVDGEYVARMEDVLDLCADQKRLRREVAAWERQRNAVRARIKWMFTTDKARAKMATLTPTRRKSHNHCAEVLEDGRSRLERGGSNVAKAEIAILRREIAFLERPNSLAPPLGLIVLMALADGLLNSFFFYPPILAAGVLLPRLEHCKPAPATLTCGAA
jgi:hypothetical protein